ncbi:hypothetical protein NQ315_002856 [Exocentrus adspersus]|uniref:DDE Tnp4 domain-containing protein n=1 Tax=Exocentrus adspersus TaxID=1586481 RepID=A0AAV8V8U0_9CUCU|nr:hypothetical protein NQ315_002856 [Exocentrus adspersus]
MDMILHDFTGSGIPKRKLQTVNTFLDVINAFDDAEFKGHFRVNRSTCEKIIREIEEADVLPTHGFGRKKISAKMAVYITLWYLSNTNSFREIANLFDITMSSVGQILNKRKPLKKVFKAFRGIDGIIGAIDGCHINIKQPNTKHAYCNRKGQFSVLLQGICDDKKKFIDVFCGEPGSMHDARLLKKSSLYDRAHNGDSAYPCLPWLVPPFKDNGHLTERQKIFNFRHSSSRIVIENAFGLLKARFRRLRKFEKDNLQFVSKCVVAATVLHNICMSADDEYMRSWMWKEMMKLKMLLGMLLG